jgi:hypothetical protein
MVGSKMTFLYDYGDNWQFRIEVIGHNRKEPGADIQGCLRSSERRQSSIPVRTTSDGLCAGPRA